MVSARSRSRDCGLLAIFESPAGLKKATEKLEQSGFRDFDTYTPHPVPDAVPPSHCFGETRVQLGLASIGFAGAAATYAVQWYGSAVAYPLVVGARPPHSWPSFIPIAFEISVLCTAFAIFVIVLRKAELLRLWRPVFEIDEFQRASNDRFLVLVRQADPEFDWLETRRVLESVDCSRVVECGRP